MVDRQMLDTDTLYRTRLPLRVQRRCLLGYLWVRRIDMALWAFDAECEYGFVPFLGPM